MNTSRYTNVSIAALVVLAGLAVVLPAPASAGTLTNLVATPADAAAGKTPVTYTFSLTLASDWPADGRLQLTFPDGFALPATTSVGRPASSECAGSLAGTISGQVVTVTRTSGATLCASGNDAVFTLSNLKNPTSSGPYSIGVVTQTSAPATIDSGSAVATINAATVTGTALAASTLAAGAGATYTVPVNVGANGWPASGTVRVAFPNGYAVSATPDAGITGTCAGALGDVTAVRDGTSAAVIVTRDGTGADCVSGNVPKLILTGITNPPVSGDTATFEVTTGTSALNYGINVGLIEKATAPKLAITSGSFGSAVVTSDDNDVGEGTFQVLDLLLGNPLPADGKLEVTFPAGYNLAALTDVVLIDDSCALSDDEELSFVVAAQKVTATRPGTGPSCDDAAAFAFLGVANPLGSGSPGAFTVRTLAGTAVIDAGSAAFDDAGDDEVEAGALTLGTLTAANPKAGQVGNLVVAFTTAHTLPADGKVRITFPTGVGFGTVGVKGTSGCIGGTFAAAQVGQVVTVSRSGSSAAACAPTAITVELKDIRNPPVSGAFTADVATLTKDGAVIDAGTASGTATPGPITVGSIKATPATAGGLATYAFSVTTSNPVASTGQFEVTFPAGTTFETPTVTGGSGCSFGALSVDTLTVRIPFTGTATCAAGTKAFTITNVRNPATSGTTGAFAIATVQDKTAAPAVKVDEATGIPGVTLSPATVAGAKVTLEKDGAGQTGKATFEFATTNTWVANGKLVVVFPEGFTATGASSAQLLDGCAATPSVPEDLALVSATTRTVTLSRGNTACAKDDLKLQLGGIKTPTTTGTTGTYSVATQDAASPVAHDIDQATIAGSLVKPGPAAKIAFKQQPASGAVGKVFTTQPIVQVQDAHGNVVTTATGTIGLSLTPTATLSGTASLTLASGQAVFSGLSAATVGSYQLVAKHTCPTPAGACTVQTSILGTGFAVIADQDLDTVEDASDNCPTKANTSQANADGDAQGDECDTDADNDTIPTATDNCPTTANTDQADDDGDKKGNLCDADSKDGPTADSDADTVVNSADNCALVANTNQTNADGDNLGDACDTVATDGPLADKDSDGVANKDDKFPTNAAESGDADNDGTGNVADTDDDNDGVSDLLEATLGTDPTDSDSDGDGLSDKVERDAGSDPTDATSPDATPFGVTVEADGEGGVTVSWQAEHDPRVNRYLVFRASTPTLVGSVPASAATSYSFTDGDYPGGEHEYFVQPVGSETPGSSFNSAYAVGSGSVEFEPCEVASTDTDRDGLCDLQEAIENSDPRNVDSDGDGYSDGLEFTQGTAILDAKSAPAREVSGGSGDGVDPLPIVVAVLAFLVVALLVAVVLVKRRK